MVKEEDLCTENRRILFGLMEEGTLDLLGKEMLVLESGDYLFVLRLIGVMFFSV